MPIERINISHHFSVSRAKGSCRKEAEKEKEVLRIPTLDRLRLKSLAIRGRSG